jgi:hypothetical protein
MPSTKGVGSKATGYAGPELGPFRCSRCTWYKPLDLCCGGCGHPEVIADKAVPKVKTSEGEKASVHADACCNEFRPLTRIPDIKFSEVGL